MARLDWIVLAVYLVAIVAVGVYAGRGNRRLDDFFLAGREMRWWAIGLSVMATQISAITFIGTTGQAYTNGMRFLVFYFGLPFAMVILCMTLVPMFYRAGVFTAYEYLERRFDARTRSLTSFLFLASRCLGDGVVLYAPSVVLAVILGWNERATIIVMGLSTIAYVIYGGNKSVIWTDVVQMSIIWFGILVCVTVAVVQLPRGFALRDALALAQTTGRLRVMDFSPSLSTAYTVWGGLIGGLFLMLSYFGCDQSQVQRYLSGSSLAQSRLSLLFNAFLKVPMQFLILLTGVLVFVFYHFHPQPLLWNRAELRRLEASTPPAELQRLQAEFEAAERARALAATAFTEARRQGLRPDPARYLAAQSELDGVRAQAQKRVEQMTGKGYNDTNYIFPSYILGHLPRGLAGLVIAVIFAAAMSTLSGELNSLASASMVDFYKRYVRPAGGDAHDLMVSRLLTALWGGLACLVAMQAGRLGSAIEVVNRFGSYFYGSILGVFALAALAPRADGRGAFYGLFVGMISVALVSIFTSVHFLWYNVIGAATVYVTGLVVSAASPVRATS